MKIIFHTCLILEHKTYYMRVPSGHFKKLKIFSDETSMIVLKHKHEMNKMGNIIHTTKWKNGLNN